MGAAGLWLANRLVGKAAVQSALNTGFKSLMEEMRAQNAMLVADLERERKENNAERVAWASERATMRGELRNLMQTVESLKALLRRNGVQIPDNDHPRTVDDPPAPVTVLRQEGPGNDD